VVIGRGASAIDIAVLLHEAGANATLVARKPELGLNRPPSWRQRLRPASGIGPGWKSWFSAKHPGGFHRLPEATRLNWVRSHLGPAGCWFMSDRIARVPQLLGHNPIAATVVGNRMRLTLAPNESDDLRTIEADHVIAATGYRPRLDRLTFIHRSLRHSLRSVADTPILSAHFESSVAGLYFIGPVAANSFGPLMRFAYGANYAARQLSGHVASCTMARSEMLEPASVGQPAAMRQLSTTTTKTLA
jgi:FAD-dependent urate hydroxylase